METPDAYPWWAFFSMTKRLDYIPLLVACISTMHQPTLPRQKIARMLSFQPYVTWSKSRGGEASMGFMLGTAFMSVAVLSGLMCLLWRSKATRTTYRQEVGVKSFADRANMSASTALLLGCLSIMAFVFA